MFTKDKNVKGVTGIVGFIGPGMSVEGRLSFEHTIRIDGSFKGEIEGKGTIVVGDNANVEAVVCVDTAIITGKVTGTVEAETRVEIKAPGQVFGEIKTPNLIIGDGSVFEGNSVMTKKPGTPKPFEVRFSSEEALGAGGPARPGEEGIAEEEETRASAEKAGGFRGAG